MWPPLGFFSSTIKSDDRFEITGSNDFNAIVHDSPMPPEIGCELAINTMF